MGLRRLKVSLSGCTVYVAPIIHSYCFGQKFPGWEPSLQMTCLVSEDSVQHPISLAWQV